MAALFADEDFPLPVVLVLRSRGYDVITTFEAGLAGVGTDDDIILAQAVLENRAVLTMNKRDFIRLHRLDSSHSGIIVCSRDRDYPALANRVHAAISATAQLGGKLVRVNRPSRP